MASLAHGVGVDLGPGGDAGLELLDPLVDAVLGTGPGGIADLATDAECALGALPATVGDLVQAHAVGVVTGKTKKMG